MSEVQHFRMSLRNEVEKTRPLGFCFLNYRFQKTEEWNALQMVELISATYIHWVLTPAASIIQAKNLPDRFIDKQSRHGKTSSSCIPIPACRPSRSQCRAYHNSIAIIYLPLARQFILFSRYCHYRRHHFAAASTREREFSWTSSAQKKCQPTREDLLPLRSMNASTRDVVSGNREALQLRSLRFVATNHDHQPSSGHCFSDHVAFPRP